MKGFCLWSKFWFLCYFLLYSPFLLLHLKLSAIFISWLQSINLPPIKHSIWVAAYYWTMLKHKILGTLPKSWIFNFKVPSRTKVLEDWLSTRDYFLLIQVQSLWSDDLFRKKKDHFDNGLLCNFLCILLWLWYNFICYS